jgi:hypothetical protein
MLRFPAARMAASRTAVRAAAAVALPGAAALALSGCASAASTCVVRHHLAIVIFQNGSGNYSMRHIVRFRLTLNYGSHGVASRTIYPRLALHAAHGGNPPVVVRTYRAGPAVGCRASHIKAHM